MSWRHSFLPILAGLTCLILFCLLAWFSHLQEERAVAVQLEQRIHHIEHETNARLNAITSALDRMAKHWIAESGTPRDLWESGAYHLVEDHPELRAVEWASPDLKVQWVVPLEGNEAIIGLDLMFEEDRARSVREAIERRDLYTTHAIDLVQGGVGFLIYFPLFFEDEFDGLIVGVIQIDRVINSVLAETDERFIDLTVMENGRQVFESGAPGVGSMSTTRTIEVPGSLWTITARPSQALINGERNQTSWMLLTIGFFTALTLGGTVTALVVSNIRRDILIQERGQALQELKTHQDRFELAVRGSSDGIWDWDVKEDVAYFSPRFKELLGYNNDELPNSMKALTKILHPEDKRSTYQALSDHLDQGIPFNHQVRLKHKNGQYRWFSTRGMAIHDESEAPIRMAGSISDITELVSARERAEIANTAKSEFLANMSHEIRTPMNGILGMARIMEKSDLPASAKERLQVILNCGDSLMHILNDILDLSKIEAGQLEINKSPFELMPLLLRVTTLYGDQTRKKGLILTLKTDEPAWRIREGDPIRLTQLLNNLVSNALKFTEKGRIDITVKAREAHQKNHILIEVRDTGIGMDERQQRHVFDKFVQADSSITRRFGGTGLGLAICQGLAQKMGAKIYLESRIGVGSTFTIDIPMPILSDGQPENKSPIRHTETLLPITVAGCPARLLAADDNAINRTVLKTFLETLDIDVTIVNDGKMALEAFYKNNYDLILLDIQMPVIDGEEALYFMRDHEANNRLEPTPIIALTANAMVEQVQTYLEQGFDAVVEKPINPQRLYQAMRQMLYYGTRVRIPTAHIETFQSEREKKKAPP
ncbi:ATP-binding protein [Woodsholea maritima]|uniref:ATP-binding protein n=1 Tax=Woodsholea maritima TaxID=240237 RepID=UPI00036A73B5|nr:ATP-binding protein [Woodsholea maritima]